MKKRVIGIYSDEMGYAGRLMDYFNARNDMKVEVRIFTGKESLLGFLQNRELDVLLVDEKYREDIASLGVPTVVWLVHDKPNDGGEGRSVFKFQRLDGVAKDLMRIWMRESDALDAHYGAGGGEVVGIHTPYGDADGFSLALTKKLSETYATLHLNMEWCPTKEEGEGGLTDLLYFIHERKRNFPLLLSTLIEKRRNVDVITPVCHFKDLLDLDREDVHRLIKELRGSGNYEKIVIQWDYLGEHTLEMLSGCDRVIVPVWKNKTGTEKIRTFQNYIKMEEDEDLMKRVQIVEIPLSSTYSESQKRIDKIVNTF